MNSENYQPYVLTQDTKSIFSIFDRDYPIQFNDRIDQYFGELVQAISLAYPNIETYMETDMQAKLGSKVSTELEQNPQKVCLCLDRFLLTDLESRFPNQFARLAITRTNDGRKNSRQGNLPIDQQFQSIAASIENRSLIIVDDGLFSGGTTQFVIDKLYRFGVKKSQVEKIIAFLGNSQVTQLDNIPIEFIADIPNLFEWIDIRDFGVFGGKQLATSRKNNVTTAIPYLFPWSLGEGASLDKSGQLFTVSQKMIQSFISLISDFEAITGKPFKFRDLVKSGFPLPTNQDKTISISINNKVIEYLQLCIETIKTEQQREVIVLDMDGTLYQLDGKNNGYSSSRLEATVLENCQKFIITTENCSPETAKITMAQGLKDPIGLSNFLSQRYEITREDYFNIVWNINPKNLIANYQTQAETVKQLSKTGKKLILLTTAAKVWQEQVINFLGLTDCFESIYTGESFTQKEEIFKILSERYRPENITSVGDQEITDIIAAAAFGCKTLLVQSPNDFERLLI
ncbi:MAG: HAD hydrolase-like protein [Candidatus Beckwithbacteria bacterium]|nr:HAD hydrolase-like protein [Candidatus Beckwithbacteria bacterium]